jgi:hypothetical protein
MKLLIIKFSPIPVNFSVSFSTPYSVTPSASVLRSVWETNFHTHIKQQAKLYFSERREFLRNVSPSCLTILYISNSCRSPWYDCDHTVSCTPSLLYSSLLFLPLPRLLACAVRSMALKNRPSNTPSALMSCTSIPVNLYKGETMGRGAAFDLRSPLRSVRQAPRSWVGVFLTTNITSSELY